MCAIVFRSGHLVRWTGVGVPLQRAGIDLTMRTPLMPLLALLALGCGQKKTPEQDLAERRADERARLAPLVAAHRAKAEPILAALRAADEDALAAPPVTTPAPLAAKLVATTTRPDQMQLELDGILIASPGWMRGASGPQAKLSLWPSLQARELTTLLAEGWFDTSGYASTDGVTFALESLAKVRHLVVLRTHEHVEPTIDEQSKTYTPGNAAGDVLVYSIPDGKRLGAIPFTVEQSGDSIQVKHISGTDAVKLQWRTQVLRTVIDLVATGPS